MPWVPLPLLSNGEYLCLLCIQSHRVPLRYDSLIVVILRYIALCGGDGLINLLLCKALAHRSISYGGYLRTQRKTPLQQADGDLVCVCLIWHYLCLMHNHSLPPFHPFFFFLSTLVSFPVVHSLALNRSCLSDVSHFSPCFVFAARDGLLFLGK